MELRQYFSVIWKWLWLIVLGTLLAGGTAYMVSKDVTPVYQASTTLLISEAKTPEMSDYTSLLTSERLAKTYSELLKKRPIMEEVIRRFNLALTPDGLAGMVSVQPVRDTQLIELKVEGTDPHLAGSVANEIPKVFIEEIEAMQLGRFASSKENLAKQMAVLEADVEAIQQAIDALRTSEAPDQAELARLQSNLAQYQSSYSSLLKSYEEIRLAEAKAIHNVIVVEPAQVPKYPIRPRTLQNTLLAAVVGCMLAVGVAFLIEYLDDTIKTSEDVEEALGLSTLGTISRLPSAEIEDWLIAADHPRSHLSEAYRALRTNIQFSMLSKPLKTLLVTSANPLEGKSTTVANLGVVMAQAGMSVVIVDSDLRRPLVHEIFQLSKEEGLTDVLLQGNPHFDSYLQATNVKNLRVLTSGTLPPNPSELLGSKQMTELIERLKGKADVVLFDSPPTLAVTDAAVLANQVDGVLLVIDAGACRREPAVQAMMKLNKIGANILGAVLNKVSPRSSSYYYYSYSEKGETKKRRSSKSGLLARVPIMSRLSGKRGTVLKVALGYLAALAVVQVFTSLMEPWVGLALQGALLLLLLLHTALAQGRPYWRLLLSLAFAPLVRLLSLLVPLAGFPLIYRYLITSVILFLATVLTIRALGFSWSGLGVNLRGLPVQLLVGLTGLALGYIEYVILEPEPLAKSLAWEHLWLPALILLVSTGLVEELIFRGVMQRVSTEALQGMGIFYVAAIFAVLHLGHRSHLDVLFLFGVALFFGWVVARTGSILGVSLSHGLINIVLFLVLPLLTIAPFSPTAMSNVATVVSTAAAAITRVTSALAEQAIGWRRCLDTAYFDTIATPWEISRDGAVVATNLLLALLMALTFGCLSAPINRALEAMSQHLPARLGPFRRLFRATDEGSESRRRKSLLLRIGSFAWIGCILLLYGLVFSFLDPSFDLFSQRGPFLVSLMAALVGLIGLVDKLSQWLVTWYWRMPARIRLNLSGLPLATVGVLFSRNCALAPGIVFGLPSRLETPDERTIGKWRRALLALVSATSIIVVGGFFWFLSILSGSEPGRGPNRGAAGMEKIYLLIFLVALETLFFQMIPVSHGKGRDILAWNKLVWGGCFVGVSLLLVHTLINPNSSWLEAWQNEKVWLLLMSLAAYAGFAIVVWAFFRLWGWKMGRNAIAWAE